MNSSETIRSTANEQQADTSVSTTAGRPRRDLKPETHRVSWAVIDEPGEREEFFRTKAEANAFSKGLRISYDRKARCVRVYKGRPPGRINRLSKL